MAKHPLLSDEHEQFREAIARFTEAEIKPHINAWDEAGTIPRELYKKFAELEFFGIGYPEALGGSGETDNLFRVVQQEALASAGSGGLLAGLFSMDIALPPILNLGTDEQKQRFIPPVLKGDAIAALAVTEPSGGSDVANLKTRAERDGDDYLVSGQKTFITSGMNADIYTVAVRTGGPGMAGVSLLVIERDRPGFSRDPLKKMGWWCSDTATLYFDQCRVPASNLIGAENAGFMGIMQNFNSERLGLAAQAVGLAQCAIDESVSFARDRETFGKPLIYRQVIRHKLVDMQMRCNAARSYLYEVATKAQNKQAGVAELCMLKNLCTEMLEYVAGEAVQIHGGAGYMRETPVERIFRETKVLSIGGGAAEIMKDLAARQMNW